MWLVYSYDDLGVREFRTTAGKTVPRVALTIENESTITTYSLMSNTKFQGGNYMNNQDGKIKTFVKEHKRELLVGAGIIITGGVIVHLKTVSDIAMNSLNREERRVLFEQKEIWESIERLDHNAPINKFDRIPRKLKRIEELDMELVEIAKDKLKVKRWFTRA